MPGDGLLADVERLGNGAIRLAPGDEPKHLDFTCGQIQRMTTAPAELDAREIGGGADVAKGARRGFAFEAGALGVAELVTGGANGGARAAPSYGMSSSRQSARASCSRASAASG